MCIRDSFGNSANTYMNAWRHVTGESNIFADLPKPRREGGETQMAEIWEGTKHKVQALFPQVRRAVGVWVLQNAVFATIGDLGHVAYRSGLFGLPQVKMWKNFYRGATNTKQTKKILATQGIIADSVLYNIQHVSKYFGDIAESGAMNKFQTAMMKWQGFTWATDTIKAAYQMTFLRQFYLDLEQRNWGKLNKRTKDMLARHNICLLYTSPSPRDRTRSRMPSSA